MLPSTLITAALAATMAQAKPEAVVLTTTPIITRPALTSSRTLAVFEVSMAVERHLQGRIEEAWSIKTESTPPIDEQARTYYVNLDWPTPHEVVVGIADADLTLAERSIEVSDVETAKVMSWLLIRSTIERSLIRPTHEVPPVAEGSPEEETPPIEEAPPEEPPVPELAATPEVKATTVTPVRREGPKPLSLSLHALGHFDSGSGVSGVPAIQFRYRVDKWLIVGGEITFRHEERAEGAVDLYHLPLTGFVGMRPWEGSLPIELGLATTFDPKVVALNGDGGLVASFWVGPYARARYPFYSFGDNEFAIVGDAALQFNLRRYQYQVAGQTHTDGVVDFRLSGGLEWAWH